MPSAGSGQDSHLNQGPPDDTGVGSFRLITEFGLTFLEKSNPVSIICHRYTLRTDRIA